MKYNYFLLIVFILFSLCLTEETNSTKDDKEDPSMKLAELEEKLGKTESTLGDSPEELAKKRKENEKKFLETVHGILKDLGLEDTSKITREQFKTVFGKIFEKGKKEKSKGEAKKEDLAILQKFANQIFENLVSKDQDYIDVDKILDYFQPKRIIDALKTTLKALGLHSLVDALEGPLTEALEKSMYDSDNNNNNTNSNSVAGNDKNKTEEKNADL